MEPSLLLSLLFDPCCKAEILSLSGVVVMKWVSGKFRKGRGFLEPKSQCDPKNLSHNWGARLVGSKQEQSPGWVGV